MNTTVVIIAVALLAIMLIAWAYSRSRRTTNLMRRFGPEYDRLTAEHQSRRKAEAELEKRRLRVERLAIHPLPADERARFAERWNSEQAHFVDEPKAAV